MVELKKVILVQNVNEKEPALETVAVENEQPSTKDFTTPNETTTISKQIIAAVVATIIFVNVLNIGNYFIRRSSPQHAHLQGQIQQIKGLYDQSTLPPKPMPNHRIYPEADLYASEEFRKEMAKRLNEQQQKLREIQAQSAAGHDKGGGNGAQTQH